MMVDPKDILRERLKGARLVDSSAQRLEGMNCSLNLLTCHAICIEVKHSINAKRMISYLLRKFELAKLGQVEIS